MSLLTSATATLLHTGSLAQQAILAKLSDLPPFSPVLNKLLASLGNEDFSYGQIGRAHV